MATTEITVTRGATFPIGNAQFYTNRRFPMATLVTVNGEGFLEVNGELYNTCGWCEYGTKSQYGSVFGGVCFQCNGSGHARKVGTVEAAAKVARRRVTDRARAARKAAERAAEAAKAGTEWRAANADLADLLDAIYAELAEAGNHTSPDAAYAAQDAVLAAWGDFLTQMANQVGMGRPLTENQTAAAAKAIDDAVTEHAAEAARLSAQRYYGTKGDKIVVTGTVTVAARVEVASFNGYSTEIKMLVIVEGTGDLAGVTFKLWGTGATLYTAERGQTVEIRGTIKDHSEYEGVKQTVITRGKLAQQ